MPIPVGKCNLIMHTTLKGSILSIQAEKGYTVVTHSSSSKWHLQPSRAESKKCVALFVATTSTSSYGHMSRAQNRISWWRANSRAWGTWIVCSCSTSSGSFMAATLPVAPTRTRLSRKPAIIAHPRVKGQSSTMFWWGPIRIAANFWFWLRRNMDEERIEESLVLEGDCGDVSAGETSWLHGKAQMLDEVSKPTQFIQLWASGDKLQVNQLVELMTAEKSKLQEKILALEVWIL